MTALTPTRTRRNNSTPGFPGWSTDIDRMIEDLFSGASRSRGNSSITEHDDRFEWSVDMPGVGADNIEVNYNENDGTLSVATSYEQSDENTTARRSYHYTVRLGKSIDTEDISAEYEEGVLTITLPKIEREENVRQIEVT